MPLQTQEKRKFVRPQMRSAKLIHKAFLNPGIIEATLAPLDTNEDDPFVFIAGQFISIKVSDRFYRAYSLASSPEETNFKLIIAAGHDGLGSNFFKNAQINDIIDFIGPAGHFCLPDMFAQNIAMFATGTGLAPFISFFYQMELQKLQSPIKLFLGTRTAQDLYYLDMLEKFTKSLNLSHAVYLSQEQDPNYNFGRIGVHCLDSIDTQTTQFFICGNPFMVEEVGVSLLENNVLRENLFFEKFTHAHA